MRVTGRFHVPPTTAVRLGAGVSLLLLNGCTAPIPEYSWTTDQAAVQALADRSGMVRTIEARCDVVLRDGDGERIALDGALAARLPDHFRVRAWKLDHAAFDVTTTPEGVWIDAPEDLEPVARDLDLRLAWSLASGVFLQGDLLVADHREGEITLVERDKAVDRPPIVCIVDARTLTPRRYEVRGSSHEVLYTVKLDRYRRYGEIIWPQRIVFESRAGTMTVDIQEAEFNGELAPLAFEPPRRAVRRH